MATRKTKRQLAEAAQEQMGHPVPAVESAPAKGKGRKRAPAPDVAETPYGDLPEGSHPEVLGRGFLCRATGQLTDGVWTVGDRPGVCNI